MRPIAKLVSTLLLTALPASPAAAAISGRWAQIGPERAANGDLVGMGSHLLAGGRYGLYVSDDFGVIWTRSLPRARHHDGSGTPGDYELAIDAAQPAHVWAGVYEGRRGGGVRRSTDGGLTFAAPALAEMAILRLARDPVTGALWTAPALANSFLGELSDTSQGLWRSADDGVAWQRVESFPVFGEDARVPILQVAAGHVYAVFDLGRGRHDLWTSSDDGVTWESQEIPDLDRTVDLAAATGVPGAVAMTSHTTGGTYRLRVSVDAGRTWSDVAPAASLGGFLHSVAFGPGADPMLFVSGRDTGGVPRLWRSADFGTTWEEAVVPDPLARIEARQDEVWVGHHRSRDGGRTFESPRRRPPYVADELLVGSSAVGISVVANGDLGLAESTDAGGAWRVDDDWSFPIHDVTAHPLDANRYFALDRTRALLVVTLDQPSEEWHPLPNDFAATGFAVAANQPEVVWAIGADDGAVASDDGGATWTPISIPDPALADVAIDRLDAATVVLLARDGEVLRSRDAGATWTSLGRLSGTPHEVVLDPSDPQVLFVATSVGLFRSADGGATWRQPAALRGVAVHAITVDADRPGEVLVATDRGIRRSVTHGRRWHLVSGVWVRGAVWDVAFDPADRDGLYATGPHGIVRFRRLR